MTEHNIEITFTLEQAKELHQYMSQLTIYETKEKSVTLYTLFKALSTVLTAIEDYDNGND